MPDVIDDVGELRFLAAPPVDLPKGFYWFSDVVPTGCLVVESGSSAHRSVLGDDDDGDIQEFLGQAQGWFEHLWAVSKQVAVPSFVRGDEVITAMGEDGIVRDREIVHGRWSYRVFAGGQNSSMSEKALKPRGVPDDPMAWVAGEPVDAARFAATLTRAKLNGQFTDTVFSFRATRTLFRPYQFKPVLKLLNSGTFRMLIADEVGLGKTIEAGLVWTELEARRRADRVLVVCPSALVEKWKREMEERFAFELVELDGKGLAELAVRLETGKVPPRVAFIASIERLRTWDGMDDATALGLGFDLVVVDEAHAFRNSDTKSHDLGRALSQWADALVFLSATPVNLRTGDLYNLLELLVPGEFDDLTSLDERIAPNAVLHRITGSLLEVSTTNVQRRAWLAELREDALGAALLRRPAARLLVEALAQETLTPRDVAQIKRLCSELHGLSAEITRTRKVEVQDDKAVRAPQMVAVPWTPEEHEFYQAYLAWCRERAAATDSPLHFAMQMPLRLAGSCLPAAAQAVLRWPDNLSVRGDVDGHGSHEQVPPAEALIALARRLDVDTKFEKFRIVISDLKAQRRQALVFTHSRATLAYLSARLADEDVRVASLHGGIDKDDRHRIMEAFRSGEFDIVLATRVASEGLDFEFCSALVNYDLPWNPMEVEQRIGRIDRFGQRESRIVILNFHTPGTIETDIIERVHLRIGVFEHAIGALEPILETVWKSLEKELLNFDLSPAERDRRTAELMAALEEQELALQDVESAAPFLISSDGLDIAGLEEDLVSSGRYVGQDELARLVGDWAANYGGRVARDGHVLSLTGNEDMASHVLRLVSSKERTRHEVDDVVSRLRDGLVAHVSVEQEHARQTGLDLLNATHPLVRAALGVPGHRQARLGAVSLSRDATGVQPGKYLCLHSVARWNGVRPLNEVWTAVVDLETLGIASDQVGDAVMSRVAEGTLNSTGARFSSDLGAAVTTAKREITRRQFEREESLIEENDAIAATREQTLKQSHDRRVKSLEKRLLTLREKSKLKMVPAAEGQLRKERERFSARSEELVARHSAMLSTTDLAVCLVEVV